MTDDLRDLLAKALERVDDACGTGDCRSHIDEALAREDAYPRLADTLLACLPPEAVQDWRDGRALRLLREALPGDAPGGEIGWWRDGDTWGWRVEADYWTDLELVLVRGRGPTLAEAADEAREELG